MDFQFSLTKHRLNVRALKAQHLIAKLNEDTIRENPASILTLVQLIDRLLNDYSGFAQDTEQALFDKATARATVVTLPVPSKGGELQAG